MHRLHAGLRQAARGRNAGNVRVCHVCGCVHAMGCTSARGIPSRISASDAAPVAGALHTAEREHPRTMTRGTVEDCRWFTQRRLCLLFAVPSHARLHPHSCACDLLISQTSGSCASRPVPSTHSKHCLQGHMNLAALMDQTNHLSPAHQLITKRCLTGVAGLVCWLRAVQGLAS